MLKRLLPLVLVTLFAFAESPRLVPVTDAAAASNSSNPGGFLRVGPIAYFYATDTAHGREVWRTDGTPEGTFLLRDFEEGKESSFVYLAGSAGNLALLHERKNDGSNALWSSDGTVAGTRKLADVVAPGTGFPSVEVIPADTRVFVIIWPNSSALKELWVSDLAPGSYRKIGNYPIAHLPDPAGAQGRLFFVAGYTGFDQQLWVSDGSALRTHAVARRTECSLPSCDDAKPEQFFPLNGGMSFLTKDALWRTDGTPSGTQKVFALDEPQLLALSPSIAYLTAGGKFWRTDGSSTGTRAAGTYDAQSVAGVLLLDDGRLLMLDTKSSPDAFVLNPGDGTEPVQVGTFRLTGQRSTTPLLSAIGNRVLFASSTTQTSSDVELWVLDVDARTQTFVQDIDPRQGATGLETSQPEAVGTLNGRVLFSARTLLGRELWSTDGTAAGTMLLKNINPDGEGGIVTGRVLNVAGSPVAGALVSLCRTEVACENATRADAEGRFRLEAIEAGEYVIAASHLQYVTQFWDRVDCPCAAGSAKRFPVTTGFETAGIEFALKKGGVISGTVRRATGEPVPGAVLLVRDAQDNIVHQTITGTEGTYSTRGLAPGQYWIETRLSSNPPLINQIHPAQNCIAGPCTIAMGQPITVNFDSTVPNIDFALHEYKTISGTVRYASGAPAEFIGVEFRRDGRTVQDVTTDANGVYRSYGLPPGSYYVRVLPSDLHDGVVYPDTPCLNYDCGPGGTAIPLGIEHVAGIDLTLTQKGSRVAGVIRDRNGAPYANIDVVLLDHQGYYIGYGASAKTNAAGRYVMNLVPPGRYWIRAHDELYPGVDCPSINPCNSMQGATPIDVTAGNTTTLNMQLRSERMSIAGRLIDAKTGAGIDDPNGLWLLSGTTGQWVPSTEVNPPPGVPGAYQLTFISRENSFYVVASAAGWHRTAHPDKRLTCDSATLCVPPGAVAVGAGVKTGIDITMTPKGVISGVVTMNGKPVERAQVFFTRSGSFGGNTFTDKDGRYRWPHAEGSYNVHVEPYGTPGFIAQVYPNRDCAAACDPKTGDVVTAADGSEVQNVDFRVKPSQLYGSISGRVVDDETGEGLPNVFVGAGNGSAGSSARTDAQGYYTIDDELASGDYRMYAETLPYYVSVYGGKHCPDFYACDRASGTLVRVNGPNATTGIDFRMVRLRVKSVSPESGPPEGGTRIVIAGAQFPPGAKVKIGDKDAEIVSIAPNEIVAITPPGSVGPAHITVIASESRSTTLTHGFTYTSTSPRRRNSRH